MAGCINVSTVAQLPKENMTSAKILYLARYRVPHAIMSLQPEFTQYLKGVDRTCIASPVPKEELWPIFEKYGIDTSTFDYAPDSEIYRLYPQVNNWVFSDDYRGYWLRQQALKLAFLDYLDYDLMVMNDPDCILIRDYWPMKDGVLNYMVLENERHSWGYYQTIKNAMGFDRLTPHCFISEYVPVLKQDITDLRLFLEKQHGTHWLDALIDACPGEPTVPPWGKGEMIRWLSEYEIIGNWTMSRRSITTEPQRRYMYDDMSKIGGFDPDYHTAVCDAVPELHRSVQFDWDRKEIVDFQRWMDMIKETLARRTGEVKTYIDEPICPGQAGKDWLLRPASADDHLTEKYGNSYNAYKKRT
jgi:hypothetical protein